MTLTFDTAFTAMPLIAIVRGVTPADAKGVGGALADAGFTLVEVPLNSPSALESIAILNREFASRMVVGAGTVLTTGDIVAVRAAGGRYVVSPNCDPAVIRAAIDAGMDALPGVATPTEAFAAIAAGARRLKLFPAEAFHPKVVKALFAVLPARTGLMPVGGVDEHSIGEWLAAGATGFGFGGSVYLPGDTADVVAAKAVRLVAAYRSAVRS